MTSNNPLPRDYKLKSYSGNLRRNMTKQEKHLWYDYLRTYPLHFYRQRIIGSYIVDFYCPSAMIAIELDGAQHYEDAAEVYDSIRSRYLKEHGIAVLRFTNGDVNSRFQSVCDMIDMEVKKLCHGGEVNPPSR